MPKFSANGVDLYYQVTGEGFPLVWSHEFGGNYDSWDPEVKFFSRRYRVITYSARGYPPSDVPTEPQAYFQELATQSATFCIASPISGFTYRHRPGHRSLTVGGLGPRDMGPSPLSLDLIDSRLGY